MKKYFMKGTGEELKFGDIMVVNLRNETGGKTKHFHVECKFIPELANLLLEEGIIEEKEEKKKEHKEELLDFFYREEIEMLLDSNAMLIERIEKLEKEIASLKKNAHK